jgi:hypothetical protein
MINGEDRPPWQPGFPKGLERKKRKEEFFPSLFFLSAFSVFF